MAFGNALGNSLVRRIQESQQTQPTLNENQQIAQNNVVKQGATNPSVINGQLAATNDSGVIIGVADRPIDWESKEYIASTGQIGSAFPSELVNQSNPNSPFKINPLIVLNGISSSSAPGVTRNVLERAQNRLSAGDRVGSYLELYKATGNEQLLIQAQITSYSGVWGGGALTGNFYAKLNNTENYNLSLDQFSWEIAGATIGLYDKALGVRDWLSPNAIDSDALQLSDQNVWNIHEMKEFFPGNSQMADAWNHGWSSDFLSAGSQNAVAAFIAGAQYGKRPAEFANNPNYTVLDGDGRFIQVIDNDTGFTEVFWDKEASFAGMNIQLDNVALDRNSHTYQSRLSTYEFMQANQPVDNGMLFPSFNPMLRMADGSPVGSPNINGMFIFDNPTQNWQAGATSFNGAFWGAGRLELNTGPSNSALNSSNVNSMNSWRDNLMEYRQFVGLPAFPLDRIKP